MLQRTVGNRATTAALQRWIKFKRDLRFDAEWARKQQDLDAWILTRYQDWAGRKKIAPETATAIRAKVKEWILDDEQHTALGGKHFMQYAPIFEMARTQVGGGGPVVAPSELFEMPDAAPLSPSFTPIESDEMEDVVPTFRRAASVGRELGPPEVEDDADRDRVERRRHRKKEYSEKVVPRLRYVPFERRKRDKLGTVEQATQPFDFGSHAYELQGGSSHRMTKKGGGSAPPYDVLIKRLRESAAPVDDKQIAVDVRALLENGANPGLPKRSWPALAEILAVVQGPEMSRASVAIDAFAAAIHWVAEGNGSLEAAFVGTGAVYLGANKGGAAALRGDVASLPPQKRGPMERQTGRADDAMAAWASRFVDKHLENEALEARLTEVHQQILTNMQRFVAML
jgi:hypothetical protein